MYNKHVLRFHADVYQTSTAESIPDVLFWMEQTLAVMVIVVDFSDVIYVHD